MTTIKNIEFVTDKKGNRKKVLINYSDFENLKDEIENLEDALTLEKAKKNSTGFKKWKDFIKEVS